MLAAKLNACRASSAMPSQAMLATMGYITPERLASSFFEHREREAVAGRLSHQDSRVSCDLHLPWLQDHFAPGVAHRA